MTEFARGGFVGPSDSGDQVPLHLQSPCEYLVSRRLLVEIADRKARQEKLAAEHGMPERISAPDALALAHAAHISAGEATADDVYASIYRDDAAADAWLESNRVHHGHPALAKVPMPDGRVVGILDLRPALERLREEPS